jgi:TetR/AcrR family transcriptional regulator, transcriptional repressor for nem operon
VTLSQARKEPSKKERTRERIVQSAARALRREGFEAVGVAEIMKEAGLTHGGFYAHFPSREALLVEALDAASAESVQLFERSTGKAADGSALEALIDAYLSDAHAAHPEQGCTLAALGAETSRQSPKVRGVATRRLRQSLALLEAQLPGTAAERRDAAQVMLATLVGSLMISRIVNDADLGRSFRKAAKRFLRRMSE